MAFKISTTGVQDPVIFNDLGGRIFNHPTIDYDLEQEYSSTEIAESQDIQNAITNGYITVKDEYGNPITNNSGYFLTKDESDALKNSPNPLSQTNPVSDKYYSDSIHDIIIPIVIGNNRPYLHTGSNRYKVVARFIFRGTNIYTPIRIKATAWVRNNNTTGAIKIYDVSSGLNIVENTNITNTTEEIVDLGVISNLPATESIWEVQIRKVSGSSDIYISSVIIEFV